MKIKKMFFYLILTLTLTSKVSANLYSNVIIENTTLEGNNTFSEKVYIKGRVTVSEGSKLTIREGTKVIFLFIDEEKDNIGESEILSQGKIEIMGTKENPVIFESDRKHKGSWLGLSIMNVDEPNIIKNAVFQDSYMALHAHFSNLNIENCIFKNNYRGFQSQEGKIRITNTKFFNNDTALQFRNSSALLKDIEIWDNKGGLNFLYSEADIENIKVHKNILFNVKIRHSKAKFKHIQVYESLQNFYSKNSQIEIDDILSANSNLRGLSFEESEIKITKARIKDNSLDGISLDNSNLWCNEVIYNNNARYDVYIKGKSAISNACLKDIKREKIFGVKDDFSSEH
ncbi:MAG: hypothetical protein N2202_06055 [Proteobacteria bacterium]|nr:hypothetical protein [Pseudomonadota bacterium]